jgi:hypothetical protein
MTMSRDPRAVTEARWPAMVTTLFVFGLVLSLPEHYQAAPPWFSWLAFALAIASMLAVWLAPRVMLTHRVERYVVLLLVAIVVPLEVKTLVRLMGDMITQKHGYGSVELLESAVMLWTMNILLFALLYWQVDRARLEVRPTADGVGRDFKFAEMDDAEPGRPWLPTFVEYLYLSFVTSASFSPPDHSRPRSHRAKIALMLQATISLTTLFVIASRAIATLT